MGRGGGMITGGIGRGGQNRSLKLSDTTTDPVSDAASALEKLRENPGDKQAVEVLERALKKLKERDKPDQHSKQRPKA